MAFVNKVKDKYLQFGIIIFAALLFIPFLGSVNLFDWDEINFAEAAREMITSNDYLTVQINYQPFWEKPPLFIWMQVLSMKVFGVNEFAARFPNAICGIVTLLVLFNIGEKVYNKKFGLVWVITYCCSILPFFYFKSGIIDPWFNLFIFLGIYFFIQYSGNNASKINNAKNIIFSALFIGLGIMTKGPVAFLIFALACVIFYFFNHFKLKIRITDLFLYLIVLCFVGGFWFIIQIINGNFQTVYDFIIYQVRLLTTEDAGHGGIFLYHFIVLLFGVFPASIFAIGSFYSNSNDSDFSKYLKKWMLVLFWVVLILFSLVKTKIIHYSSLCYFPLTFLASYFIYKVINNEIKLKKIHFYIVIAFGTLWGILVVLLQLASHFKSQIINSNLIKDEFAVENIKAGVHWTGYEFLIGLILIIGLIISVVLFKKQKIIQSIFTVFISSLIFTFLTMLFIVPRIEGYSQNSAIEFYKKLKDEDCYVQTLGFKSYAHLFYSEKKYYRNEVILNTDSLLNGKIEKPAYFVTKITKKNDYFNKYNLNEIYEKNGFVFFVRNPSGN